MDLLHLLTRCKEFNTVLISEGDKLRVQAPEPLPPEIMAELREHKQEILSLLRPCPPLWHAETIAAAVRKEGICLFWSELFGEMVAFIRDDSFLPKVTCGMVAYTDRELRHLFGDGKLELSVRDLKRIHQAKKAGGKITGFEPKGAGG